MITQKIKGLKKTMDLTPTWEALIPVLCEVLENNDQSFSVREAKITIRKEFLRLARIVDNLNSNQQEKNNHEG